MDRQPQRDESIPAHPEGAPGHPLVIFGDHRFCALDFKLAEQPITL